MSKLPLISIIIPTYNRAFLIGETLDSILAQTYENWECIVVDDGSTDHTKEVLEDYCAKDLRFRYHQRPKDRLPGGNAARNYGFEISKGEYINWFDSDDLMALDKLEVQVAALKASDFNFCVCQTLVFKTTIENTLGLRHPKIVSENCFEDYVKTEIRWLTQAPLWKKDFLNRLSHLFDEELRAGQEWEFHSRVLSHCETYFVISTPLVYLRKHSESISNDENRSFRYWNYIQARLKVSQLKKVKESEDLIYYLNSFNLKLFKKLIVDGYLLKDMQPLFKYFFKKNGLSIYMKTKCFIVIITVSVFGRGSSLLKKVSIE
ncbi:glycosyltransferase family 2 protein [Winogradskyella vidalii]|uniref:glycosyltransferase family 2 protein n=1 Tax=Winogradskyella vidalii TaxID=2615024 RepID=UPI0015C9EF00|nr:glycosyltransferase family 2 protein [Winogradskyella vidalii]